MIAQRQCTGQLGSARIGSANFDTSKPLTKAERKAAMKQAKLAAQEEAQRYLAELDLHKSTKVQMRDTATTATTMSHSSNVAASVPKQTAVEGIATALLEEHEQKAQMQEHKVEKTAWFEKVVSRAQKKHQLAEAEAISLTLMLAVGGAISSNQTMLRLRKCASMIDALCGELDSQQIVEAVIIGAAAAHRFQQSRSSHVAERGDTLGAARWLQLLFNEVDALDEDGIADWWEHSSATPGGSEFARELESFLGWLEDADTEDEDAEDGK